MIGAGPYIKMSKNMNKQLQHVGFENSCGACALQYLGLPKNIIDVLVKTAEGYSKSKSFGLRDLNLRNNIRAYENTFDKSNSQYINDKCLKTQIYLYGSDLYSSAFNPTLKKILIDDNNHDSSYDELEIKPLSNELIDKSLNEIYKIIPPGYATVIGFEWKNISQSSITTGHYTIISKSINNNLYLIENQVNGYEGIYKNPQEIREYFKSQGDVNYFITFECGKLIDASSDKWIQQKKTTYDSDYIVDYPTIERQPSTDLFKGYIITTSELEDIFFNNRIPSNWTSTIYHYTIQYLDSNIYAFNNNIDKHIFLNILNPIVIFSSEDIENLSNNIIPEGWSNLQGNIFKGPYNSIYDNNNNILKIPLQEGGKKRKNHTSRKRLTKKHKGKKHKGKKQKNTKKNI